MPWCPNCHTEYENGVEKCEFCNTMLVSKLPELDSETAPQKTDDYIAYEMQRELDKLRNAKSSVYVKKAERYEDVGSSAIIFLGFGSVGFLVVLLNVLHILNLPFFNIVSDISKFSLLIVFAIFFVIGVFSWKKAKQLKSQIAEEENITEKINQWMEKKFTNEFLKAHTDDSLSSEINFLNQIGEMKQLLILAFPDVESDYLDMLIEEYYNSHFSDTF